MSSSFRSRLSKAGLLGMTKELCVGHNTRYLYYTRFSEEDGQEYLVIGLSDGIGVWKVKLAEDALKELSFPADAEPNSNKFIDDISQALQNGNVELTKLRDIMKLNVSYSGREVDFDLTEMPAAARREESQMLLFTVWDSLEATRSKLCQAETSGRADLYSYGGGGAMKEGEGGVTESTNPTRPKRIKGASLFNPNTKRRKAATGVVFDKDDN